MEKGLARSKFNIFIYELWYPSLLGAVIYEIFTKSMSTKWDNGEQVAALFNQLLIAAIFVTDWFLLNFAHPRKEIGPKKTLNRDIPLADLFISILFIISFFFITNCLSWFPLPMLAAFAITAMYLSTRKPLSCPSIIMVAFCTLLYSLLLIHFLCDFRQPSRIHTLVYALIINAACAIIYFVTAKYIIKIHPDKNALIHQ